MNSCPSTSPVRVWLQYIAGMVIYTGKETRIQMNAAKTPLKVGESYPHCRFHEPALIFHALCWPLSSLHARPCLPPPPLCALRLPCRLL